MRALSPARPSRGFTLLEVLVAIAILGLGLSVILSSQVGLFWSAARTESLSQVTGLARCRMAGIEVHLAQDGYPMADETDQGPCCGDDGPKNFTCSWKIERVELPQPASLSQEGDGGVSGDQGLGPLGALASVQQTGGAALGGDGGLGNLAGLMTSGAAAGGVQGMAPLLMSMVYPDLKLMLEASIRKVTVTVQWREGGHQRHFDVTQYITDPRQGGLDPNAAQGLQQLGDRLQGQQSSGGRK